MSAKRKVLQLPKIAGFQRSFLFAFLSAMPGFVGIAFLLFAGGYDALEITTVMMLVVIPWAMFLYFHYRSSVGPWRAVVNILLSFKERDYSIRAAVTPIDDVVCVVLNELNAIADSLSLSRSDVIDTQHLLSRILAEVDVAVFLFNQDDQIVMANRYGAGLFDTSPEALIGQSLEALNLGFAKYSAPTSVHEHAFITRESRWLVKHSSYRQQGQPHQFILLADIGQNLRKEELEAWQKLTRILSHEINNALTPLKTSVVFMRRTLPKIASPGEDCDDMIESLDIIDSRIDSLNRLVNDYGRLARLPQPDKKRVSLTDLCKHLVRSFEQQGAVLLNEEAVFVTIDEAQIEQVLVNVLKNAVEANHAQSRIELSIIQDSHQTRLLIDDYGQGIENMDNIFVPYFTTKAEGSGIGLIISRQIIEAHGGSIRLMNHPVHSGCRVEITFTEG